ncbi:CvfB family protein [Helicobacter mustelae]|uniref:RNA-binding protein n=1 Tax=Helicobacter mustelae (strain ATCC 43772 / CCUG 25715 / CIP 103759 / LMG 18044 / NCTC 12198 / R85-136P) TaxID=679897 RepID=D3UFR8_HELM1|nr:S1-like domain-containing RNA-binding protein [Helicobacter mustelae]CBG39339.1 conserved hypothetical protein [Helicobacter mustelae 12198]SQH70851.1 Conserved virulence factor B [Helicobacter mustelae]
MEIGFFQELQISRFSSNGAYLCDEESSEVLLPNKFLQEEHKLGQKIRVFVSTDSEDRMVATTQIPYATRDQIAVLEIASIEDFGCFLDIGLDKDIFMPTKNPKRFHVGQRVCVFVTLDRTGRLIAKLGIKERLKAYPHKCKPYNRLSALPFERTPLGIGCVVEERYYGLLYHSSLFSPLPLFSPIEVQIQKIRTDGRLDLRLCSSNGIENFKKILDEKKVLNFHYDSCPKSIQETFGMSKKLFKKTLTALIKQKIIKLENQKIYKLK